VLLLSHFYQEKVEPSLRKERMEFDTWLSQCLLDLKTDEAVFGPYIKSILEGDEELEQKIEDLNEILTGLGNVSNKAI
jgi:hypothetical protein